MSPAPLRSHPDRDLTRHLNEVDRVTARILARHQPRPFSCLGLDVGRILSALAGWHDVGKATAFFQEFIADTTAFERRGFRSDPSASPSLKNHTPIGAFLALRYWSGKDRPMAVNSPAVDPRLLGLLMALAVRGHHTRLPSQGKLWGTLADPDLPEQMACLPVEVESCHPTLAGAVGTLLSLEFQTLLEDAEDCLKAVLDYLKEHLPLDARVAFRLAAQFCFSCLLEADKALLIFDDEAQYLGTPGLVIAPTIVEDHPPPAGGTPRLDQLRQEALSEVVRDATAADLDDSRPRILTLPTGLGKTRCAAAWAFHWRDRIERATGRRPKIVIVLPFLSIIDQTARVYRRELLELEDEFNDETLEVSHSLSARDYSELEDPGQAEFALDTWRSDIVLTTFDQFLLALMDARTKHQQRFHNLCDAIVVLDEVQAFPCHLWHPVGTLIRELARVGRTRFLLMTATQPGLLKPEESAPVIQEPARFAQSRYRLEHDPKPRLLSNWVEAFATEMDRTENSAIGKWLIVMNTRRAAQEVYRFLQGQPPREHLFLLSSDIVPIHRLERIGAIRQSRSCVAVTTQCVEAGVDLDMDQVIRDFGPLDSLVQVAGRCNRHGLRERGSVRVVHLLDDNAPSREFSEYIYDPTLLGETSQSLPASGIDEDELTAVVEDYFRRLHSRKETGRGTTDKWSMFEHDELNVSRLLRGDQVQVSFVVGKLDPGLRRSVESAWGIPDRWQRRRRLREIAPRIARVTVSAWKSASPRYIPSDIADPFPAGRDKPAFWFLRDEFYDPEIGLCLPQAASTMIF